MPPGPEPSLTDLKRSSAAWILKIKEKHKLPQVAVQGIITQVTSLFQVYLSSIHRETQHHLQTLGFDQGICATLNQIFDSDGSYGRPFRGLETEYRQRKYYKDNFHMVVSTVFSVTSNTLYVQVAVHKLCSVL